VRHPNGLGNNNDIVGRNLQGHAYVGASGLFDRDVLDLQGPGATMALCDFNHGNPGMVGGGMLANEFFQMPHAFAQSHGGWGREHKKYQRENYYRIARLMGPIQEMPVFDSRVTVDPEVKDHWGIPVPAMSGGRHPYDTEYGEFLATRAEEILLEAGALTTNKWWAGPSSQPSGGQHQAGTCRMGNDPRSSVVDRFCRIHDVDNVFIADGSVLPTNGGFNPVLTIMATAFRTGEYIARNFDALKPRTP
jgi:choline dehydrogenase-like flavoprotein